MAPKIIVACGSGVATSQTVASKVRHLLGARNIEADVQAVDIKNLRQALRGAAAYISVVKTDESFATPVFNGVAFLTGIGQEKELEELIHAISR